MFEKVKMMFNAKHGIFGLSEGATGIVGLAIVLAIGALILAQVQLQTTVGTAAANATEFGSSGLQTMASFIPIIAIALVGFVLIGLFVGRRGGE